MGTKGFHFISYAEMDKLLADNGFIIAASESYTGTIPDNKMAELRANLIKLEDDLLEYEVTSGVFRDKGMYISKNELSKCWNIFHRNDYHPKNLDLLKQNGLNTEDEDEIRIRQSNRENSKIFVVAHSNNFLPGTTNDPGKLTAKPLPDPIAVVKHRLGYIVLASW